MKPDTGLLPREKFDCLLEALRHDGYRVIGPRVEQGAVVFTDIRCSEDMPRGIEEHTEPGAYRLQKTVHQMWFSWVSTAQGVKPWIFRPEQELWIFSCDTGNDATSGVFECLASDSEPIAIVGMRACDLAGLVLQDAHFLQQETIDPYYQQHRRNLFIVAVNCHRAAQTCFCVSTGDGPEVSQGADLILDEVEQGFLVTFPSDRGESIAGKLPTVAPMADQLSEARRGRERATLQSTQLPTSDLVEALAWSEHREELWSSVADRCLTCGNCTAVCPTCFCSSVTHNVDLKGNASLARREWDSCFSDAHSHIAGKTVRKEATHKYRQWLLHKLLYWQAQYGRSGCVGCGRCITWCPAAIDIVEEAVLLADKFDLSKATSTDG